MRAAALALLVAAAALAAMPAGADSHDRKPYDIAIRVTAPGMPEGSSLLRDVEAALEDELLVRGCFRKAEAGSGPPPEGSLVLEIQLDDVVDEVQHETSLAETVSPDSPPDAADAYTARVSALVRLRLLDPSTSRALAEARWRSADSERPRMRGEDVRSLVRLKMTSDLARRARVETCRAAKKLAAAPAPAGTSPSR